MFASAAVIDDVASAWCLVVFIDKSGVCVCVCVCVRVRVCWQDRSSGVPTQGLVGVFLMDGDDVEVAEEAEEHYPPVSSASSRSRCSPIMLGQRSQVTSHLTGAAFLRIMPADSTDNEPAPGPM